MKKKIGRYEIKKSLGKGGMGEVFLAYDPVCERNVALKIIREDLQNQKSIQNKFLNEALITSYLTHPSIIPIYTIQSHEKMIYYTMPYAEGETLNEILKTTKQEQEAAHPIGNSISALIRIFLQVCEAIAYTHSKNIFHRDLKPDNIIVGKYGEVLILDWGIAERKQDQKEKPKKIQEKVAGTLSYMSPDRALGEKASPSSEIYSLGVILYKMLTLSLPFKRKSLAHFRKTADKEQYVDPVEIAPYREIPHRLSMIVKKCLNTSDRCYASVEHLIEDIKNYIEGQPEWILLENLSIDRHQDWQFHENILLAKHIAITRQIDVSEWVSMMISKSSFSGNLKIEADVFSDEICEGIGFLLNIPVASERKSLEQGFCLWIGSKNKPACQLFRSNVLVMDMPSVHLRAEKWDHITIESIHDHLHFYLNQKHIFSYVSHLPLAGTHVGLLHKDGYFSLKNFKVFGGSHNVMINCLTVPDAFLARKDYETALLEYRRIGHSFPGRAEGREALFRAGLTLLENAKETSDTLLFQQALEEFDSLHNTPGAPLEYLGKSLVYRELNDPEEEAKCLELALRKFPKHPLFTTLTEYITYRLYQSSLHDRKACYHILLLSLLHLPKMTDSNETKKLISSLQKNWEKLPFIHEPAKTSSALLKKHIAIQLCFCLSRDRILVELLHKREEFFPKTLVENIQFSLLELNCFNDLLPILKDDYFSSLMKIAILSHKAPLKKTIDAFFSHVKEKWTYQEKRFFTHILQTYLDRLIPIDYAFNNLNIDPKPFTEYRIWSYLLQKKWEKASKLFALFSQNALQKENTILNFLYGCYLSSTENEQIANIHYSMTTDTPNPSSWSLLSHYLLKKIDNNWIEKAFFFEKRNLYRQLTLYYHCLGDIKKAEKFQQKVIEPHE